MGYNIFWAFKQLYDGKKVCRSTYNNTKIYYEYIDGDIIKLPSNEKLILTKDDINATDWVLFKENYYIGIDVVRSRINALISDYKLSIEDGSNEKLNNDYYQRWLALRQLMYLLEQ